MIYERIKELCKKNKISVNSLELKLDIAKGSLCKIDKHKPSSEKMQSLAKELNTTVDYLVYGKEMEFTIEMAKTDVALSNMTDQMKTYALKMAELSDENKEFIMHMIDKLSN